MGFNSFWVSFCSVSPNTQGVKIVFKKNKSTCIWAWWTQKIKIFCDFGVFILSPAPINENPEITEIQQKDHNAELWDCSFKSSWSAAQMISISKWIPKSLYVGAVPQKCYLKKVFSEISQNSQESTCARACFLIKLHASGTETQKETLAQVFYCEFCE